MALPGLVCAGSVQGGIGGVVSRKWWKSGLVYPMGTFISVFYQVSNEAEESSQWFE